ncbi:diguanylate cyclase [Alicyclobacillus cycloheptanicus]|uniref:Diguanylate cyclase (GGDEF)-like protein n=1 Tax=Alicyclobacillus cycloheptanicus TaxID=1457 RepID=A0ABT9XK53_9BACL|nr:diguanylate cyclase [Alicyclobacillus cycloheptanicus]MDQ0190690.1 diguanylate cyclase (GGDEF)-like protein [Alicyclobacillus cycloheptanicus]WDM00295.1 diguanylate cyclase [Alicyclobacillus cycloheptanicus]
MSRGNELPALISPLLQELFGVDGGFYLFMHQLSDSPGVLVHGPFGVNENHGDILQTEVARGKWFSRLPHVVPLERWLPAREFPPEWASFSRRIGVSYVGVWPIQLRERVAGAVILAKRDKPADVVLESRLIRLFVMQVSLVLGLIIDRREAEITSSIDPLTNLSNRRGFMERWFTWHQNHRTSRSTIAIGILDVDGFKQINDQRGHWIGDQVLQTIGRDLKAVVGLDGLCARWGGDEFVFCLAQPKDPDVLTQELSRRLCEGLPTVSFGIAILDRDGTDFDGCLVKADQRMYEAKSAKAARLGEEENAVPLDPGAAVMAADHKVRRTRRDLRQ